ncbi:MAG: hypothetical protein CO090_06950, partial [Acidobacteria bacterium CG_4_9_14_3_um_filter_49_7]
ELFRINNLQFLISIPGGSETLVERTNLGIEEEPLSARWRCLQLKRRRNCTSVHDDKRRERKPADGHARFFQSIRRGAVAS